MTDYESRWQAVLRAAEAVGCSQVYVESGPSVQWLTGLGSSNAAVLLGADGAILLTDGRYESRARAIEAQTSVQVQIVRNLWQTAAELVTGRIGLELDRLSVTAFRRILDSLDSGPERVENISLEQLRSVKDESEIAALRQAAAISTEALSQTIAEVRIGMTELEIARRLELNLALAGADDRAFPSIVAAGENSATPHHEPTTRPVHAGDILKLDFGARLAGYHADCTRCFVVGAAPTDRQREIHALVDQAAELGRDRVQAGAEIASLELAVREFLTESGHEEFFTHGLGHGVGLEIHEAPAVSKAVVGNLEAGNVITIEPGVYLPNEFGIRIEDMCVVTATGCEILTHYPRELARIG